MLKQICKELKIHAPFTIFGAMTGIIIIALFQKLPSNLSYNIFYILHPIHVVLSALVTASMYKLHKCERVSGKCDLPLIFGPPHMRVFSHYPLPQSSDGA